MINLRIMLSKVFALSLIVVQTLVLSDICVLDPDVGPCDAVVPRYYYNPQTLRCEEFIWGGCGGNDNNFATKAECKETCPDCSQAPDSGPCEAAIQRWYYDSSTDRCKRFTYGGCDGNSNNFPRKKQCRRKCR